MPAPDTELELKLRLLETAAWSKVFDAPALVARRANPPCDEHLETWYFDTTDGYLQDAGLAYRIRREGDRWIATVKADETAGGGLHQRREWNITVDEPTPNYDYFTNTEAGPLLTEASEGEPLVLKFRTLFDRRKADIAIEGSRIEVAADRGTIFANGREEAIAEVELELKEGVAAAVLAVGAELVRQLPLAVEPRSKYYRALVLAGLDDGTGPVVAPPVALHDAALPAVKNLLIGQIGAVLAAYESFGANREAAEPLHQLRVELRCLRSLFALANPLADLKDYEKWQLELGTLSEATNELREADVIAAAWREMLAACPPLTPPPWLGMLLATERERMLAEVEQALGQGKLTGTLLAFWAWVAGETAFHPAEWPLDIFAFDRLTGWLDETRATAKNISLNDAAGLHRLRITGKKIRYVLESLPLTDRRTKILLTRLKKLQDCLGQSHDAMLAGTAMDRWLSQHASRVVHRDAGLLVGWLTRLHVEADEEFALAWRRVKRAARRWQKKL